MNHKEYLKYHKEFCDKMHEIASNKASDYSGEDDILANFKSVGGDWIDIGFYTRMMDKMSRLRNFIMTGSLKVKDESIKDTLQDLANYSILLSAYLDEKKKNSLG